MKNNIIKNFVDNLNIFASYRIGIIFCIKLELTIAIEIIDINLLIIFVELKVIWNWEKQIIKLFQLRNIKKLSNFHSILKAKIAKVSM